MRTTYDIFHSGMLPPAVSYAIVAAAFVIILVSLIKEMRRRHSKFLRLVIICRIAIIAILALLLTQPNLMITTEFQDQGERLLVVDDSASMFSKIPVKPSVETWKLARQCGLTDESNIPELNYLNTVQQVKSQLETLSKPLHQAADDIQKGLPWQSTFEQDLDSMKNSLTTIVQTLKDTFTGQNKDPKLADSMQQLLDELGQKGVIAGFEEKPSPQSVVALDQNIDWFKQQLERFETRLQKQLAETMSSDKMADIFKKLGAKSRWQIVEAYTADLKEKQLLNLSGSTEPVTQSTATPQTDLSKPLANVLNERPLALVNSVVLFTDGSQNMEYDLQNLDIYAKRDVNLSVFTMARNQAAALLEVVNTDCPAASYSRAEVDLRIDFKHQLPAGTKINLDYKLQSDSASKKKAKADKDGSTIDLPYSQTLQTDDSNSIHSFLNCAIDAKGDQVIDVSIKVPEYNIEKKLKFPIYMFDRKPAVLYVSDRPDPLFQAVYKQEKYGVNVYPVFTFGSDKTYQRGSSKTTMPLKPEDWKRYDVIIFQGKLFPGCTKEDLRGIVDAVKNGTNLILCGASKSSAIHSLAADLGWDPSTVKELDNVRGIKPHANAGQLPICRISNETISNMNRFSSFNAPGTASSVPLQDLQLLAAGNDTISSLGFYGKGRILLMGINRFDNILPWEADSFQQLISHMVLDCAMPVTENSFGLTVYPKTQQVGNPVVFMLDPAKVKSPSLSLTDPSGKVTRLSFGNKDNLKTQFRFPEQGDYLLQVGANEMYFAVDSPLSLEHLDQTENKVFMNKLSRKKNIAVYPISEFTEIMKKDQVKTRSRFENRIYSLKPYTVLFIIAFLILTALDFVFRKKAGLVL